MVSRFCTRWSLIIEITHLQQLRALFKVLRSPFSVRIQLREPVPLVSVERHLLLDTNRALPAAYLQVSTNFLLAPGRQPLGSATLFVTLLQQSCAILQRRTQVHIMIVMPLHGFPPCGGCYVLVAEVLRTPVCSCWVSKVAGVLVHCALVWSQAEGRRTFILCSVELKFMKCLVK